LSLMVLLMAVNCPEPLEMPPPTSASFFVIMFWLMVMIDKAVVAPTKEALWIPPPRAKFCRLGSNALLPRIVL
jgi:hypothetical protein